MYNEPNERGIYTIKVALHSPVRKRKIATAADVAGGGAVVAKGEAVVAGGEAVLAAGGSNCRCCFSAKL